jgi:glycosyltransferase involved in cell wall biosynthesis
MKPGGASSVQGVTLVLGTSAGGTGAHVRMLAAGLSRRGIAVTVAGPSSGDARFSFSALPSVCFSPIEISGRGRVGDLAGILRLRKLLLLVSGNAILGTSPGPSASFGDGPRSVSSGPSGPFSIGVAPGEPSGGTPDQPSRADDPAPGARHGGRHVVHAHGLRAGAFVVFALLFARGRRRPGVVVTVHNAPPSGGRVAGLVYRLLELVVGRGADLVLCVSPDLEARMRTAGARRVSRAVIAAADPSLPGPPVPVQPVPEGAAPAAEEGAVPEGAVPGSEGAGAGAGCPAPATSKPASGPPVFDRLAAGAGVGPGRPVVLAVGRLAAQKGFDVLLEAAVGWRDLDPVPLVLIAGDGPLAGKLRAQAAARDLPVVFAGHRDDIPARLAAAALFVMPSRWEGQPLVLQEALRAGAAIVATRVGGIPGLTGEDAALLVPPGDARALGAAVRSVLTEPDLARRLAAAARARAAALPTEAAAVAAAVTAYGTLPR